MTIRRQSRWRGPLLAPLACFFPARALAQSGSYPLPAGVTFEEPL